MQASKLDIKAISVELQSSKVFSCKLLPLSPLPLVPPRLPYFPVFFMKLTATDGGDISIAFETLNVESPNFEIETKGGMASFS